MDQYVKVTTFGLLCVFSGMSLIRGIHLPDVLALLIFSGLYSFLSNQISNKQLKILNEELSALKKDHESFDSRLSSLHNKTQMTSKSLLNR